MPTAHALATTERSESRARERDWYPHRPSGPRARPTPPRRRPLEARAPGVFAVVARCAAMSPRTRLGRRRRASLRAVLVWLSQSVGGCSEGRGRQSPALVPRRIVRRARWIAGGCEKYAKSRSARRWRRRRRQRLQRRSASSRASPEAWAKLVLCVVIDVIGDSSSSSGRGELADVAYAPLEAFLLAQLFRRVP